MSANNNFNKDISSSNPIDKHERFAKISEKLSQLSKGEAHNPQKFEKIEQKINEVEDSFQLNLDSLEQKYSVLKDQIAKFSKIIEEERQSKEKSKSKSNEEMKMFESKIKTMLLEEREYLKAYVDNAVKKVEGLIINYGKESKEENDSIKATIEGLKNYINVRMINNAI